MDAASELNIDVGVTLSPSVKIILFLKLFLGVLTGLLAHVF